MRVFIAIEFDDEMKKYLAQRQADVKKNSDRGNFTGRENFHLTLRFIGEANREEIQRIKAAINGTAEAVESFGVKLGTLGEFPRNRKKIIWIGISEGHRDLKELFEKLEANLEREGFPREEREFRPHITLGREIILNKDFQEVSKEIVIEAKSIRVESISLMESTRIHGVLHYVPIYRKKLK